MLRLTVNQLTAGFESTPYKAAYGWKSALKVPTLDNGQENAQRNADSIALFAAGVRMLNSDRPLFIADSGRVSKTRQTKRDVLPLELERPTTPAAFETFITLLRKEARETSVPVDP